MSSLTDLARLLQRGTGCTADQLVDVMLKKMTLPAEDTVHPVEMFLRIDALFGLSVDQVKESLIDEDQKQRIINKLRKYRIKFISAWRSEGSVGKFRNTFDAFECIDDMYIFDGVIKEHQIEILKLDSIEDLSKEARRFAKEIRKSGFPDYVEGALLINIKAIIQIYDEYEVFGEMDVKKKLKEIKNELDANWDELRKASEGLAARMRSWAGKQLERGTKIAGWLSAGDVVAGLLPPPS